MLDMQLMDDVSLWFLVMLRTQQYLKCLLVFACCDRTLASHGSSSASAMHFARFFAAVMSFCLQPSSCGLVRLCNSRGQDPMRVA